MSTRTIWKFPLRLTDVQTVMMPAGAEILAVGVQADGIMLWARVDPAVSERQGYNIAIVGTGHPAPDDTQSTYIGTVMDGPYVWHVFTEKESA